MLAQFIMVAGIVVLYVVPEFLMGDSVMTVAAGGAKAAVQRLVITLKLEKVETAVSGPAPPWPMWLDR